MSARIVGAVIAILLAGVTGAAACTAFEREVYNVATAVEGFRETPHFTREYGWSAKGPYSRWLDRIRELNDDKENTQKLMISHGFIPMEIYSVAEAFRTNGELDNFYSDLDQDIKSLRCK